MRGLAEERTNESVEPIMVRLEFDWMSLAALVTPLGDGTYRLEETEWEAELCHHDIILAEDLGLSNLRYIRVVQRSELVARSGVFPKAFLESAEVQAELAWLGGRGGYWQVDMGGCLFLSIPRDAETDFDARWAQMVDSHPAARP
jgi:hypothetical protein